MNLHFSVTTKGRLVQDNLVHNDHDREYINKMKSVVFNIKVDLCSSQKIFLFQHLILK